MRRTLSIGLLTAVFCLGVTGQSLLAKPKKVKSGAMDICRFIDGGDYTIVNGTEVCCARERRGDEEEGQGTGPFYCVQCDPPGSNNCELWSGQGPPADGLNSLLLSVVVTQQQSIVTEQQRVSAQLGEILTRLGDLQSRADNVVAACAPPDLFPVPVEGSLPPSFCRGDGQGNLIVRVKNQGLAAAPASTLRVTFSTASGPCPWRLPRRPWAVAQSSI
jgi:hypothetical protein